MCCSLLTCGVRCVLFVVCRMLIAVRALLFVVCNSLCVCDVCCLLFVSCRLVVVWCFLRD